MLPFMFLRQRGKKRKLFHGKWERLNQEEEQPEEKVVFGEIRLQKGGVALAVISMSAPPGQDFLCSVH